MAGLGDRVSSHYGFGAARLAVCGEPHLAPSESLSGDLDHLRDAGRDFIWSAAPALALASLVFLSLLISVTQDASDRSDIQMLVWRDYPVHEEPLAPEPVPEPEPIHEPPKKKPGLQFVTF